MRAMIRSLDRFLAARGFDNPDTRRLVRIEILTTAGAAILAVAGTGFSAWGFSCAAGAGLMLFNFWHLAKAAKQLMHVRKGGATSLVLRFYGRLILTGVVIAVLVGWLDAPVTGLLTGLSTVLVGAAVWGFTGSGHKAKEA